MLSVGQLEKSVNANNYSSKREIKMDITKLKIGNWIQIANQCIFSGIFCQYILLYCFYKQYNKIYIVSCAMHVLTDLYANNNLTQYVTEIERET